MTDVFIQLGATLGIALIISVIMKLLRQPLVIGYIITGIIVGPSVTGIIPHEGLLESFSHIGIALLLFIVGLGLRPSVIKDVGKVATITGLAQIIFTTIGGYAISRIMGFAPLVSFYVSLAFALSSTIIILRILYDKKEQDTLYGKITIGFLLVQDVVAMLFLIGLSAFSNVSEGQVASSLFILTGKMALTVLGIYLLLKFVVPHVDRIFADNKEMLFIFGLGVCFVMASVFYKLDFSMELGALVAGIILSVSPYQREIASRIQSLRDFFLIIFFVVLGANVHLSQVQDSLGFIIAFSLFILIGNPIIMILVMRWLRYTLRTSFFAGLTVSQISEFSLIVMGIGIGFGHLPEYILGPATIVSIITIGVSTYYITYNHQLLKKFKKPLSKIFPDRHRRREKKLSKKRFEVILFGAHRLGGGLISQFKKMKVDFLIVDHDPRVIESLINRGVDCVYGSADDPELIEDLPMVGTKLIISTVPDADVNVDLLKKVKKRNSRIKFLCVANQTGEADKMYKAGATYVIMPPYLGRRFMVDLIKKNKLNMDKYKHEREKHIFDLEYLKKQKLI